MESFKAMAADSITYLENSFPVLSHYEQLCLHSQLASKPTHSVLFRILLLIGLVESTFKGFYLHLLRHRKLTELFRRKLGIFVELGETICSVQYYHVCEATAYGVEPSHAGRWLERLSCGTHDIEGLGP